MAHIIFLMKRKTIKKLSALLVVGLLTGGVLSGRTYFHFDDFFKAEDILKVSKRILDVPLQDFSVAYLTNEECRLLRNSIFYYHGHDFKSEELKQYFSDYYSRDREDKSKTSKKELSKIDNENVKLLQMYEKRAETSKAVLEKTKIPDEYIGKWYLESFMVGNDSTASLKIQKDNTFILLPGHNGGGNHLRTYEGKIYIYKKTLYLYIEKLTFCSERRMGYFDPQYDDNARIEYYEMTLDKPIILYFPVTVPERSEATIISPGALEEEVLTDKYIHMNLGTMIFFKEER